MDKLNQEEDYAAHFLYKFVKNYIEKHDISCGDSVQQMDSLVVDAPNFMEKCCEIVGYNKREEE